MPGDLEVENPVGFSGPCMARHSLAKLCRFHGLFLNHIRRKLFAFHPSHNLFILTSRFGSSTRMPAQVVYLNTDYEFPKVSFPKQELQCITIFLILRFFFLLYKRTMQSI